MPSMPRKNTYRIKSKFFNGKYEMRKRSPYAKYTYKRN